MKKAGFLFLFLILNVLCTSLIFADENEKEDKEEKPAYVYTKQKTLPQKIRPKKASEDEILAVEAKNEEHAGDEYIEECTDTFKFGLETEISTLLDELTKNEDLRLVDPIYDLFYETKSPSIRSKILSYFTKLKDPCLGDYAVAIINEPYEEKKEVVSECFTYVSEAKVYEAVPGLVDLVEKEDEDFFTGALAALGEIGGSDEAQFLATFIDRDDLSVSQRQSLMRVLGRIKALETWDKLSEIAQDEDENSFVRMYAAEAIGAMEKPESEEILVKLFEENDPMFRVYVIKGITHYSDKTSDDLITQALRDSQWKVRMEAIDAVRERKMKDCVPYLVYRCKDKSEERVVKEKCYEVIAELNTEKGNEYLVSLITDKKTGDNVKAKVSSALLKYGNAGTEEIIALAKETLSSDIRKNLRYALGKEFAKYARPEFTSICSDYISHADVATQGTGLDIWAKGRYPSLKTAVEEIAKDADIEEEAPADPTKFQFGKKKKNANAAKAKRILQQTKTLAPVLDAVSSPDVVEK